MDMETSNGKRKMEAQAIYFHPFNVCSPSANGSLPFVRLLKKKKKEVIH
jgi:hypothetical protein